MSSGRANMLTPLAIMLTPIVVCVATWLAMYLSQPLDSVYGALALLIVMIPFGFIFVALIEEKRSRGALFRGPLFVHVLVSCFFSCAIWMLFWLNDPSWGSSLLISIIGVVFCGPIVFVSGLGRIRRRGERSVPTGECVHCGYNLAGLEKDTICPECGQTSGD